MVHIIDNYFVNMDELNYTLVEKKISKKGTETFSPIGYYSSLQSAVVACRRILVAKRMSEGVFELSEAIKIMEEQTEKLKEMISF